MQILVLDDDNLIISYRVGGLDTSTLGFSHEIYRYSISENTTTKLYAERFADQSYKYSDITLTKATDGRYALCFLGRFYIFSGDTLMKTGSVDIPGKIVVTMVMSPDLSCYAYRAKNPGTISGYGKYYVADTATGEKRFDDYFWAYDVVFSPDGSKIAFACFNDDRSNTYLGILDPVTGYWNKIKLNPDQEYDYSFFGFTWLGNNTVRCFNKITQSDEYRITTEFGVEINRVNLSDGSITTDFKFYPESENFYNAEIYYEVFSGDLYVTRIRTDENIQFYRVIQSGAELVFKYPYGDYLRNRYDDIQALPGGRYVMLCSLSDQVTGGTVNQNYQIIVYK